jgi:hypothetical protein
MGLHKLGVKITAREFSLIWPIFDVNGDGEISYAEFITSVRHYQGEKGKVSAARYPFIWFGGVSHIMTIVLQLFNEGKGVSAEQTVQITNRVYQKKSR